MDEIPTGELVDEKPRWRPSPGLVKAAFAAVALAGALGLGTVFQDQRVAEAEQTEAACLGVPRGATEELHVTHRLGRKRNMLRDMGGGASIVPLEAVEAPTVPYRQGLKLVRNGNADLRVDAYAEFEKALGERMKEVEGFLAGESKRRGENGKIEAVLTLQIPPDRFEGFIARLGELGVVEQQSMKTEDVTKAYVDLQARLKGKETLAERLKGILANASGKVEELVAAESNLALTLEQIDQIKGELAYYDQITRYSTLVLRVLEKHHERPFEIVESLDARLSLAAREVEDTFARAQKAVADAGGQVLEAHSDENEASARVTIDAPKLPALRAALLALGEATEDVVLRKKEPRGARDVPLSGTPLRAAPATLALKIALPRQEVTRKVRLRVETGAVEEAFAAARAALEEAGAKIQDGGLAGASGAISGRMKARMDVEKLAGALDRLRKLGTVKEEGVEQRLPEGGLRGVWERAELELGVSAPEPIIAEENGAARAARATLAGSWSGFLWSLERIFVGASLAAPWAVLGALAGWIWRRRKASASLAASASSSSSPASSA